MPSLGRFPLSAAAATYAPVAVGTSAATVHTAVSTSGYADDMWLHATNTTAAPIRLTLSYAGVAIYVDIPPAGSLPTRIFDGLPLASGGLLTALAASAGLYLSGWVNRYKAS